MRCHIKVYTCKKNMYLRRYASNTFSTTGQGIQLYCYAYTYSTWHGPWATISRGLSATPSPAMWLFHCARSSSIQVRVIKSKSGSQYYKDQSEHMECVLWRALVKTYSQMCAPLLAIARVVSALRHPTRYLFTPFLFPHMHMLSMTVTCIFEGWSDLSKQYRATCVTSSPIETNTKFTSAWQDCLAVQICAILEP